MYYFTIIFDECPFFIKILKQHYLVLLFLSFILQYNSIKIMELHSLQSMSMQSTINVFLFACDYLSVTDILLYNSIYFLFMASIIVQYTTKNLFWISLFTLAIELHQIGFVDTTILVWTPKSSRYRPLLTDSSILFNLVTTN